MKTTMTSAMKTTMTNTMTSTLTPRPAAMAALGIVAALVAASPAHASGCEPAWDPGFGVPGANTGIVFDFAAHDDGGGACRQLYASGSYTAIGGVPANRVARWDGATWHPLGSGLSNNECYAIASYGGDLYAAGYFDSAGGVPGTAKLARWDGSAWHSLGAQLELFSNQLWDLVTWDDGNGEMLYVVGNFETAGGVPDASFIAKWDGTAFSALGSPITGGGAPIIFTAYAWDDGDGEALYVGGRFTAIDGVPANRIARFDGSTWSALGSGITGTGISASVMSMVAFDDGDGEALYVAGQTFNAAGGVAVSRIARWDGGAWSAVGDGFADGIVWGLEVFDDGAGAALYAFGTFTMSGVTEVLRVAKWTGAAWAAVDGGADGSAYHARVFDDGGGSALYVGGQYTSIAGLAANRIARYVGCAADPCPEDLDDSGAVDFGDILAILSAWGGVCAEEDLDGSGAVDFGDLLRVLGNWGPCSP